MYKQRYPAREGIRPLAMCVLTSSLWFEGKLELSLGIINTIAKLLAIGVEMRKPADTSSGNSLEEGALRVEKVEVCLVQSM